MITLVFDYKNESEEFKSYFKMFQKQQNNLIHCLYNRIVENPKITQTELRLYKKTLNNLDFINAWWTDSAIFKAYNLYSANNQDNKKLIFGGKKLFIKRCENKITKEEFQEQKMLPIYSVGDKNNKGNRNFRIKSVNPVNIPIHVVFQPNQKNHFELELINLGKNNLKKLQQLENIQNNKTAPLTYQLSKNQIFISFDESLLTEFKPVKFYMSKKNRILSLDLNPNYIGYSIMDWDSNSDINNNKSIIDVNNVDTKNYKIIKTGVISIKDLSDEFYKLKKLKYELKKEGILGEDRTTLINKKSKYVNDKKNHNIVEISKELVSSIFKGYNCDIFVIEKLNIKNKDNNKGKRYNRLVNNLWNRNLLIKQIGKRLKVLGRDVLEVVPEYSSFIGNILYKNINLNKNESSKKLPDMVLSSIELNRRGFLYNMKYINPQSKINFKKNIESEEVKVKLEKKNTIENIVYPDFQKSKEIITKSLEEFSNLEYGEDWKSLYNEMKKKNLNNRVRVSLEECLDKDKKEDNLVRVLMMNSKRNKVKLYSFT